MEKTKERNGLVFNLLLATIFFNIWFPKAGIKLSGIPLTIGNIFFAILLIFWLYKKIKNGFLVAHKIELFILSLMFFSLLKYIVIGDYLSNIGYIIPLIVYPIIFFIVYDLVDSRQKERKIIKVLIGGFFFICLYALVQYILGIEKVCIPGLTVNLSDYMQYGSKWYLQKNNNNTGIGTKMISTYQNGNLFGVNTLLIYPIIYSYFKKNNKIKLMYMSLILFVICVFLSLSRACWLGIVLFMLFGIFFEKDKTKKNIERKITLVCVCCILIIISFKCFPTIATRFSSMDKSDIISMSGRTEGLQTVIKNFMDYKYVFIWLIGSAGFIDKVGLAYEMTPLAILVQIGLIGVVIFYVILYKIWKVMENNIFLQKGVKLSIFIWVLVGCIEGAFWLPPTALNLFFILALGLASKKQFHVEEGEK